jgi:AbrB family looped-hinge helix DNA binding protein
MTTSTISANGQTTIPAKVREFLHLGPADKVFYRFEDNRVVLEAAVSSTEALYGAFKTDKKAPTKEQLRALRKARYAAKEAR